MHIRSTPKHPFCSEHKSHRIHRSIQHTGRIKHRVLWSSTGRVQPILRSLRVLYTSTKTISHVPRSPSYEAHPIDPAGLCISSSSPESRFSGESLLSPGTLNHTTDRALREPGDTWGWFPARWSVSYFVSSQTPSVVLLILCIAEQYTLDHCARFFRFLSAIHRTIS